MLLDAEPVSEGEAEAVASRLREELADADDRLLRLQAEFENFRKRALRERQEALQYGSQNLFKDLLSVVDNLERAIDHARESGGGDLASFLQGVELVQRELLAILEKHHVTEIEALGKPFDPALHEAMAQVESGAVPPNTVDRGLAEGLPAARSPGATGAGHRGQGGGRIGAKRWGRPPADARPGLRRGPRGMGKVIGIDLGTTNSCVALFESGEPQVDRQRRGRADDAVDGGVLEPAARSWSARSPSARP